MVDERCLCLVRCYVAFTDCHSGGHWALRVSGVWATLAVVPARCAGKVQLLRHECSVARRVTL